MRSFATGRIQPKVLFTKEWTHPYMQQSSFQAEVYTYALSNCESLTFKKRMYKAKLGGPKGWAKVEIVRYSCDAFVFDKYLPTYSREKSSRFISKIEIALFKISLC